MNLARKAPDIENNPSEIGGPPPPAVEAGPDGERQQGKTSGVQGFLSRWERLINRPG